MNTIIFDMGMVLVDFRWRRLLEDLGYDKKQTEDIGKAVFRNPLWQQFDWGIMDDESILAQMKLETPTLTKEIDHIWENFRDVCRPYPYAKDLVHTLHEMGYKIYILSNYGKRLFELDQETFTFLKDVDGGVISYEVQQMKPNANIYQTLLAKYNIVPKRAVFFDDHKENCEAARDLGLGAVEVHGLETILEGLEKYYQIELAEIREKYL